MFVVVGWCSVAEGDAGVAALVGMTRMPGGRGSLTPMAGRCSGLVVFPRLPLQFLPVLVVPGVVGAS